MIESHFDVAIAGGGHAGLTMALGLSRAGRNELKIAVVDRDFCPPPRDDPRAVTVSLTSRRLLQALGAWGQLASEAQEITKISITDSMLQAGLRPVLLSYRNIVDDSTPGAHVVSNTQLASVLLAELAGEPSISLIRTDGIRGFSAEVACARLVLTEGKSIKASLVIGADGRNSIVREAAGIRSTAWAYDQTGIVTRVTHERPHNGCAIQHFLPAGPFAILPMQGNRSCVTWTEDRREASRIMSLDDTAFLAELDRRFGGTLGALELDGGRAAWPLTLHLARRYIGRRTALIGDAAHSVHPIAGQGLNLAFRDVAALTEAVIDSVRLGFEAGDSEALHRYERWRRFDSTTAALAYDGLNRLFRKDIPIVRSAREVGLGLVNRFPLLKRILVAEAAGMTGDLPKLLRGEPV